MVGELLEDGVPDDAPVAGGRADGARTCSAPAKSSHLNHFMFLVGKEDSAHALVDKMGLVHDPPEPNELEQRLHTLAVGSPPVRRVAVQFRSWVKHHGRTFEPALGFDDGHLPGQSGNLWSAWVGSTR